MGRLNNKGMWHEASHRKSRYKVNTKVVSLKELMAKDNLTEEEGMKLHELLEMQHGYSQKGRTK